MNMSGERQGWSTWARYEEAGIVGNDMMFTDDKIEIAHAIGKTRDTIGKCWPMDAAVAFSLASKGPGVSLKAEDLVNQHTKMAAAMMTQMVGYGTVPDPRVESCGHDEVDARLVKWRTPYLDDGIIKWNIQKQSGIRGLLETMKKSWDFRICGEAPDFSIPEAHGILMSPKFAPLRIQIEKKLKSTKWDCASEPFTYSHTLGECKWKGEVYPEGHEQAGSPRLCAHHDQPSYTGWVLIKRIKDGKINDKRFVKIWNRGAGVGSVHQGWNNDMIAQKMGYYGSKQIAVKRVVLWDKVARSLSNSIWENDPKFVIKNIKESLRRMQSRNLNCVARDGERSETSGRILPSTVTYRWKNWEWLAQLKAWIAQTSKKNRKEHDLVNGWKWTKYDSKQSYGFEIAKFKWIPGKANEKYVEAQHKSGVGNESVYTTPPAIEDKIYTYYVNIGGNSWNSKGLPYRFKSKQEAYKFKNFLSMMAGKCGAVNKEGRTWNGNAGIEEVDGDKAFTVMRTAHSLEMGMDIDPENTPNPTEIMQAILFGTPQEYDEHIEYITKKCATNYKRPVIKKVEEEQKVVA